MYSVSFSICFFISFIATALSLILLRPLAEKINFLDYPNHRKKHTNPVPLIGGCCIFIGVMASQIYINEISEPAILLIPCLLILIIGIWDDIVNLKAKTKIYLKLVIVTLTVYFLEIKVESLGHLFGFPYNIDLGLASIPFTIIAVIALTNAFNMIDGLDGLFGVLAIIAIMGIFLSGFATYNTDFFKILLALVGGLIPFLILNIFGNNKTKVFLGDGGSLFIGFLIGMALIKTSQTTTDLSPSFVLWCIAVPVFDLLMVIILRKISNYPLMVANRDHIHHYLETFGLSKSHILILVSTSAAVILLFGYLIENYIPFLSLWFYTALFMIYVYLRLFFNKKIKN